MGCEEHSENKADSVLCRLSCVAAASPRFGLGSAAVAEAIWRLLRTETAPDLSRRQSVVLETDPLIPAGKAVLDK